MTSKVTHMYRTGDPRRWTVALSCGHKFVATNDEVKANQLFVGKGGVACSNCLDVEAYEQDTLTNQGTKGAA